MISLDNSSSKVNGMGEETKSQLTLGFHLYWIYVWLRRKITRSEAVFIYLWLYSRVLGFEGSVGVGVGVGFGYTVGVRLPIPSQS